MGGTVSKLESSQLKIRFRGKNHADRRRQNTWPMDEESVVQNLVLITHQAHFESLQMAKLKSIVYKSNFNTIKTGTATFDLKTFCRTPFVGDVFHNR